MNDEYAFLNVAVADQDEYSKRSVEQGREG